jgi:hypothetical protein
VAPLIAVQSLGTVLVATPVDVHLYHWYVSVGVGPPVKVTDPVSAWPVRAVPETAAVEVTVGAAASNWPFPDHAISWTLKLSYDVCVAVPV